MIMEQGKIYLIEVPGGKQLIAEFLKEEKGFYHMRFNRCGIFFYSNKTRKIESKKFGIEKSKGVDHLILKEIK